MFLFVYYHFYVLFILSYFALHVNTFIVFYHISFILLHAFPAITTNRQSKAFCCATGWRIRIAGKVNQNTLQEIGRLLVLQHCLVLAKNPPYLPHERALSMKLISQGASQVLQEISEGFLEELNAPAA